MSSSSSNKLTRTKRALEASMAKEKTTKKPTTGTGAKKCKGNESGDDDHLFEEMPSNNPSSSKLTEHTLQAAMAKERPSMAKEKGKSKSTMPEPFTEPSESDDDDDAPYVPPLGESESDELSQSEEESVNGVEEDAKAGYERRGYSVVEDSKDADDGVEAEVAEEGAAGLGQTSNVSINGIQMMHAMLGKMAKFESMLESSPLLNVAAARRGTQPMVVEPTEGFLLTPSKKSFGKMRKSAHKAATKIVFQRVALLSPSVAISEVGGAVALAINLTVPSYITGSISNAFIQQMKKTLTQLLREVKSDLVGWVIDTFLMMWSDTIPPRISKVHESMYNARLSIHAVEFAKMLDAPGGYLIDNYPHMHTFHTIITPVGVTVWTGTREPFEP
jgi:hypothetical protein